MSIGRALKCRKRLQQYISENNIGNCQPLTTDDWKPLKKLHRMLESFYTATLCTEGNQDHLGRWLPAMEFIYSKVSGFVAEAKELRGNEPYNLRYPWLEAAAEGALEKCKKYYKLADESPAYYAAEILQPHRKWQWLYQRWGSNDETSHGLLPPRMLSGSFGRTSTKEDTIKCKYPLSRPIKLIHLGSLMIFPSLWN